jgi:hypothetical protein
MAQRPDGIFISDFEQGEIGPELFRKICEFGLEDLVSKHRDRPYAWRSAEALDQGQESEAPGDEPGDRLAERTNRPANAAFG